MSSLGKRWSWSGYGDRRGRRFGPDTGPPLCCAKVQESERSLCRFNDLPDELPDCGNYAVKGVDPLLCSVHVVGRVVLVQTDDYEYRRGPRGQAQTSVYQEDRCCVCYRATKPDAVRLRTARTNDGEFWIVGPAVDLRADEWRDFQADADGTRTFTILPIGPDCLRQRPEFRVGLVVKGQP